MVASCMFVFHIMIKVLNVGLDTSVYVCLKKECVTITPKSL